MKKLKPYEKIILVAFQSPAIIGYTYIFIENFYKMSFFAMIWLGGVILFMIWPLAMLFEK